MPWKEITMSEQRHYFVQELLQGVRMATACRKYGISRTTGYKWLQRYQQQPLQPLQELSRRPKSSPNKSPDTIEQRILQVREQYHWGALKIWQLLRNQRVQGLPSARTVSNIHRRKGCIPRAAPASAEPCQRFERSEPNQLWQCDFKGGWEIAGRKHYPLTILDDHSRFLIDLRLCPDVKMASAWEVLWQAFGEYGMPQQLLCDNAFGGHFPDKPSVSWFEARLIRLGIAPIHGRPYHPQTQGKVERLHRTLEDELVDRLDRSQVSGCQAEMDRWRRQTYNSVRPHEGLGGQTPLSRWSVSSRERPKELPELEYPEGSQTRVVASGGDISWKGQRLRVGVGLTGERVRVVEEEREAVISYGWKIVRRVPLEELEKGGLR